MFTMTRTLGLLLLLAIGAGPASAAAPSDPAEPPEPPPAPLQVEPEEPPPAPLLPAPVVPAPAAPLAPVAAAPSPRPYTIAAWSGVALTLALVTAGTTLGILAQHRSDDLSRHTGQTVDGLPPIFDAAQQDEYTRLQTEGISFNRGTTVCLLLAGVSAVATGVLFWDRQRLFGKELVLAPALSPTNGSASLTLVGKF
jgi:hypothetical protein